MSASGVSRQVESGVRNSSKRLRDAQLPLGFEGLAAFRMVVPPPWWLAWKHATRHAASKDVRLTKETGSGRVRSLGWADAWATLHHHDTLDGGWGND